MPKEKLQNVTASVAARPVAAKTLFLRLRTSAKGLSETEAENRIKQYGYNEPASKRRYTFLEDIGARFVNPLVLLLLGIGVFSIFFGDKISASIIFIMAIMSVLLSYYQEHRAEKASEKLNALVRTTAEVMRGGQIVQKPARYIVPGDVVALSAGDAVPADMVLFEAKDLYVNESSLTGESLPVEKFAGGEGLSGRTRMGTFVVSGTGLGVVEQTGTSTEFGKISQKLASRQEESSFDTGIKQFTWLMIKAILAMVVIIFVVNAAAKGNWLEAFVFALAVAVGLTPETLPMIVTINLSRGALDMSLKKVIVKRLNAIQNFGAMDVLCTDKTGTLTMNEVALLKSVDVQGDDDEGVFRFGYLNSHYQTGLKNLLDLAVLKHEHLDLHGFTKIDEVPFDFNRKIMSVALSMPEGDVFICKGAPNEIFARCSFLELGGKVFPLKRNVREAEVQYERLSKEGFRVLAVAYKKIQGRQKVFSAADENKLILKGFLAFLDPPKPTAKHTIDRLEALGIALKVITGDNELVAKKVCEEIGLDTQAIMTGEDVEKFTDEELALKIEQTTVFARMLPMQKERVVRLLHANSHTVGYLGDGINDVPAIKAADVGISVNNAVDIAKDTADIILLKKSLIVLADGVAEGRKVFGNISKYIRMSSSSNFGNMISMTAASLFLPFLPMAPIQILLNNFLYDLSQMSLPADRVDDDYLQKPRPWNIGLIKKNMLTMGPVSSLFDFATFAVLWFVFQGYANVGLFHTGWFLESLVSQTLIVYIIRTRRIPFVQSKPSGWLVINSLAILVIGLILPFSPLADAFGFTHPPLAYFLWLTLIIACYLALAQMVKSWFVRRFGYE